jgi:hypothetical protein
LGSSPPGPERLAASRSCACSLVDDRAPCGRDLLGDERHDDRDRVGRNKRPCTGVTGESGGVCARAAGAVSRRMPPGSGQDSLALSRRRLRHDHGKRGDRAGHGDQWSRSVRRYLVRTYPGTEGPSARARALIATSALHIVYLPHEHGSDFLPSPGEDDTRSARAAPPQRVASAP